MYCKYLPELIPVKNRQTNLWGSLTEENYPSLITHPSTKQLISTLLNYHFPMKEIRESYDFVNRVKKDFHAKSALELFCGHGFIGQILVQKQLVKYVYQVDKLWSKNRDLIYSLGNKTQVFPIVDEISEKIELMDDQISLVYSMHGCGSLTDIVIDVAIKNHLDVIVCPCCYHQVKAPHDVFGSHNIDYYRIAKLQLNGYDVSLKTMPVQISPMNRIIIGKYFKK